jgi:hypothetical protein
VRPTAWVCLAALLLVAATAAGVSAGNPPVLSPRDAYLAAVRTTSAASSFTFDQRSCIRTTCTVSHAVYQAPDRLLDQSCPVSCPVKGGTVDLQIGTMLYRSEGGGPFAPVPFTQADPIGGMILMGRPATPTSVVRLGSGYRIRGPGYTGTVTVRDGYLAVLIFSWYPSSSTSTVFSRIGDSPPVTAP